MHFATLTTALFLIGTAAAATAPATTHNKQELVRLERRFGTGAALIGAGVVAGTAVVVGTAAAVGAASTAPYFIHRHRQDQRRQAKTDFLDEHAAEMAMTHGGHPAMYNDAKIQGDVDAMDGLSDKEKKRRTNYAKNEARIVKKNEKRAKKAAKKAVKAQRKAAKEQAKAAKKQAKADKKKQEKSKEE